ncbi:helix-turn-helix transcriptional regulator [Halobacillus litoralis]|uniref:helix-turn-helix transcriptional regulator n=1 Tax=Halobacillus litoralis TaxID=45668 RepID=UPI001CD42382|nr:helix-turn-helix domain-containing protein [Halobacillus litoralis]MCA1023762.1 helix-turn-helix domain-containing protein [Halobacillus litoralis]
MNWINIKEHQRFQTKQELDRHVRSYLYQRKAFLSEGTREVLRYVWRHAVKFPGVAFPKRSTIVSAVRCSESTVVRALRTLEKEGLIERVQTKKPNGRQGVNLIVFLPQPDLFLPSDDTPGDTLPDTPPSFTTSSGSKPRSSKTLQETKRNQRKASFSNIDPLDHSHLPSFIPIPFIEAARPFLSPPDVLKAWRTVESAARQLDVDGSAYISEVVTTFKQAVFAWKHGWVKKGLFPYFYGGLIKQIHTAVEKETRKRLVKYNWVDG